MFAGSGKCSCENFNIGKDGKHRQLKAGAMPNESLECYHIKRARRYLAFKVIGAAIAERERIANENKTEAKTRRMDSRISEPARPADEAGGRAPASAVEPKSPEWVGDDVPF
jgi:hypothetical protein